MILLCSSNGVGPIVSLETLKQVASPQIVFFLKIKPRHMHARFFSLSLFLNTSRTSAICRQSALSHRRQQSPLANFPLARGVNNVTFWLLFASSAWLVNNWSDHVAGCMWIFDGTWTFLIHIWWKWLLLAFMGPLRSWTPESFSLFSPLWAALAVLVRHTSFKQDMFCHYSSLRSLPVVSCHSQSHM